MTKTIGIDVQDFRKIRELDTFYVDKTKFIKISTEMDDSDISVSLQNLSYYLYKYYNKRVIILLDEYDTPLQESYVNGFWEELVAFSRSLFNETFKNNPYLERALMTGITRVSKESIFSDLNNLNVVTTTSEEYCDSFGFTEEEVYEALEEYGMPEHKETVRIWYDGFTFGNRQDIYNPWSIIKFLDKKKVAPYWANTSSNRLIGKLIQEGSKQIKLSFEELLADGTIKAEIDEQIIYDQLDSTENAIWSLLLASGYLKVKTVEIRGEEYGDWIPVYELAITNFEVRVMFRSMIKKWFAASATE